MKITNNEKSIRTPLKNKKFISIKKIKPKTPIFNTILAKIIEIPTGAITCNLGNHKCNPNKGNLIKKGSIKNRNSQFFK